MYRLYTPTRLFSLLLLYIYYIIPYFSILANPIQYLFFYDNIEWIFFISDFNRKKYKTAEMTVLQYPKGCNSDGHPLTEYKTVSSFHKTLNVKFCKKNERYIYNYIIYIYSNKEKRCVGVYLAILSHLGCVVRCVQGAYCTCGRNIRTTCFLGVWAYEWL